MQGSMDLVLAAAEDAELLHKLQTEAFMLLYEKYRDDETSPAKESLEKITRKITEPNSDFYIICLEGEAVGGVRIRHDQRKTMDGRMSWISPIFVIPSYHNKGIATKAIQRVFELYPETHSWRLETIKQEAGNCHLYEKCGFVRAGEEHVVNEKMTLITYEKMK